MKSGTLRQNEAFVLFKRTRNIKYFECLFNVQWKVLCSIAYDYVKDTDIAQDAAQDALIKAYNKIDIFDTLTGFKAYLVIGVRNYCLNHIKWKKTFYFVDTVPEEEIGDDFEEIVFKNEVVAEMIQLTSLLPRQERRVLELIYQGYDINECAIKLGVTRQTVANTKHRALQHVRAILSGEREWLDARSYLHNQSVAKGKKRWSKEPVNIKEDLYDFG